MSLLTQSKTKWFRRLGFAAVAALGLGAAAMSSAPAQARELISIGGVTFPIGGHVHHDYWRNGGWYHDSWSGWHYVGNGYGYGYSPYGYAPYRGYGWYR